MNWISRFTARIGSAFALISLFQLLTIGTGAASPTTYVYQNQSIAFSHLSHNLGSTAVGIDDPGLRTLIRDLGAVITWKPGERYVMITTAQPVVISFSVGDRRYDVGPLSAQASIAPYLEGNEVYLPLDELLRALYLAPKRDGTETVLQPQLGAIDVRGTGAQATLVARGGAPLNAHESSEDSDRVVYEFDGVGSPLAPMRQVNAGGIRALQISSEGTARDPKTIVTVWLQPNTHHSSPQSNNGDFEVAFGGSPGSAVAAAPPTAQAPSAAPPTESPLPEATEVASPTPSASAATGVAAITAVTAQQTTDGLSVNVAITGDASYEWHRLREPDNRFWVDIKGAQLQIPTIDQAEPDPVTSLRVRQNDAQTVRIALSLSGPKSLTVSPSATGLTILVGPQDVADAHGSGQGSVGSVVSVNEPQTLVTPAPLGEPTAAPEDWKFGPRSSYVPTNPKLIVIDPGHGGSDRGAIRNGLDEATLNLDMAKRLRDILISRGWQVQMTRTTDVDVYQPNDSAHQELQARVDIANKAGARLFVSIHCNSFINSGPSGTTTYYSKNIDTPLAQIMDRLLSPDLGTKDDGIVKSHLYVTMHSYMPAVLVETAFLSNPDDFARLSSPDWRQKVAEAMADGIDQYTQDYPVPKGSGQ